MDRRTFISKASVASAASLLTVTAPQLLAKTGTKIIPGRTQRRPTRIPNVKVTTHEGQTVNFYEDLIKDKTVLINFFYTTCTDICPGATYNLSRIQARLGDRVGKDIFIYSLSLDPKKDTPEHLRAYAEHFKASNGWKFLTGDGADMELLRQRLGFVDPEPELDKDKTNHIGIVRFGIESLERWSAMPIMSNPEVIVRAIDRLTPRRPQQPA